MTHHLRMAALATTIGALLLALTGLPANAAGSPPDTREAAPVASASKRCEIRGWTFSRLRKISCRRAYSVWGYYLDDGRPPRRWYCSPQACTKRGYGISFNATRTLRTPIR